MVSVFDVKMKKINCDESLKVLHSKCLDKNEMVWEKSTVKSACGRVVNQNVRGGIRKNPTGENRCGGASGKSMRRSGGEL